MKKAGAQKHVRAGPGGPKILAESTEPAYSEKSQKAFVGPLSDAQAFDELEQKFEKVCWLFSNDGSQLAS